MRRPSIVRLREHPAALDCVADWIDREWGAFSGRTWQQTRERFELERGQEDLPISCVALEDGRPIGVATLRERDSVDWDPCVTPWVCNVFVVAEARGHGVAAGLCRALEDIARELGYPHVYLATVKARNSLYHQLGYMLYRTADSLGQPMYLMRLPIAQ